MTSELPYPQFTIDNCLSISEGKGGFPYIEIDNDYASGLISIYGAQVLSYKSKQGSENTTANKDLLFVSEKANFKKGKAIKGGIPICWPWFGVDPEGLGRQLHGFARNLLWVLEETATIKEGGTKVVLSLSESEETRVLFPHAFKLTLTIIIGKTLRLSLQTINTDSTAFIIRQALHAYFAVGDITEVKIDSLTDVQYLDKAKGAIKPTVQEGSLIVTQEVDRIYIDSPAQTMLIDNSLKREITVDSIGSKTTVVWNPWADISKNSADLADDFYISALSVLKQRML